MYGLLLFVAMGFVAPHLSWPFVILWLILAVFDGESRSSRYSRRWDSPRTYFGPTWESRLSDWIVANTRAVCQLRVPSRLLDIGVVVVLAIAIFSVAAGHI
jgi:hypothetical protein